MSTPKKKSKSTSKKTGAKATAPKKTAAKKKQPSAPEPPADEPVAKEAPPATPPPAAAKPPAAAAPATTTEKSQPPQSGKNTGDKPMPEISAKMVAELRDATGAKMMTCKKALQESDGDMEKAKDWLRKKGEADASKKADRTTAEGAIGTYIHAGGKIGVMVELACETDFVARNEEFQQMLKDICMHIAAANPRFLNRTEVPEAEIEKEKEIAREQIKGKPANVVDKIVTGKIDKWLGEICLLEQPFVKDDKLTIEGLVKQKISKLGENMSVARFARWELGGK
ncbi:MAG: translation elongation factor Ts [Planctomycetota bacterium]